ncbi:GSCOCG00012857001-RA-CDS, partial [Cotesia congregata]
GHQEYSSRQAGVTTGIILGCLIPILMVIICVAFRALQSRKKERESQESQMRSRTTELQRIRKIDDDINESSTTPTEIRATEIN